MKYYKDEKGLIVLLDYVKNREAFYLDNEKYYFKLTTVDDLIMELIGSIIAREYQIDHVSYQMASNNGFIGVISHDFEGDYTYVPMDTILEDVYKTDDIDRFNNIKDVNDSIKEKYGVSLENEIIDMFLFDVLIANIDRHTFNYGILKKDKEVKLSPVFDYGEMLSSESIYYGGYSLGVDRDDYYNYRKDIKRHFLDTFLMYYDNYKDYFFDKTKIINSNNIIRVLEEVEDEIKQSIPLVLRKRIINRFRENEDIINKVMCKRR